MKTEKQVRAFFAKRPIDTGGAMNRHTITIEHIEDGDHFCVVTIPLWSQNPHVTRGVVKLLGTILRWEPSDAHIAAQQDAMRVTIYEHACEPA